MQYQVELRDIEPIRLAYMRYTGLVKEANKVFPNVFKGNPNKYITEVQFPIKED